MKSTADVVVIGAGIQGLSAGYHLAKLGVRVLAVEPVYHEMLRHNVELNGVSDLVEILPVAASDSGGHFGVHQALENNKSTMTLEPGRGVRAVTLDSEYREQARLVKIDVEGWELRVLGGASAVLKSATHLFVESLDRLALDAAVGSRFERLKRYNGTPTYHYRAAVGVSDARC